VDPLTVATAWLGDFESRVRAQDFEGGRALFETSVVGYGSRVAQADGLDPLVRDQWKRVWPNIEDYRFDLERLRVFGDAAAGTLTLALPWTSTGIDSRGGRYPRPGRCTLVLRRGTDGAWRCAHSHFSLPLEVPQDLRAVPPVPMAPTPDDR
jgi:ketosteroid isomerase-like protein